jgi:hypothetical protein
VRGRRRWLAPVAALGVSLYGASSAAQIRVQVPDGCGSDEEFTRELERLLGPDAAEAQPLSVVISPPDASGTYTLRIELVTGVRELHHVDCRTLFRSAIVVAAASVRADIEAPSSSPPASPPSAESATPPSPPPAVSRPIPQPHRSNPQPLVHPLEPVVRSTGEAPRVCGSVAAGGGAVVGLLPGVAGLVEVGGAVDRGRWGAGIGFWVLPGTTKDAGGNPGVDVSAGGAALALRFAPFAFARASAGVGVYRLTGSGTGVREQLTDRAWSVAPIVELTGVSPSVGGAALELGLQAQWWAVPASFQVSGFGEVYRVSTFGAAAVARGTWHFP